MIDILGIPLWGDQWLLLLLKFFVNIAFTLILVRALYFPTSNNKNYLFSFIMISIVVFFLCFTLRKLELDMGLALGMFAIFAIIRYRTDVIPVKEMTYLFMVIGIAVINGLANSSMPLSEILIANIFITVSAWLIEKHWLRSHTITKQIILEEIELIHPSRQKELIANLSERTGLNILKVEIGDINFLRDTASVTIHYRE